jgi:hypothetical protein
LVDSGYVCGSREVARYQSGRIAWAQVKQREYEQADDRHHGQGREHAPDQIDVHLNSFYLLPHTED